MLFRSAMNDYYTRNWTKLHHIEGASQRVQEDTKRFASIMEGLGTSLLDSILTLIAFLPILHELSKKVTALPLIGPVDHSLIYVAVLFALFGTVLLVLVGYKLPGLEFKNQVVEAAYRKQLVYGEDHADILATNLVRLHRRAPWVTWPFDVFKHCLYHLTHDWIKELERRRDEQIGRAHV